MKRYTLLTILAIFLISAIQAQDKPKLIVGIVVDQMRADYIYRYWEKYSDEGFKKIIGQGFFCKNVHFNFSPTFTAPGHASVYSGTSPMDHGIIANNWFDKKLGEKVYCTSDPNAKSVGTETDAGKMTPHRMLAPTIGDATRISNNFKGKSIGISIKDRGAILPAGHSANAAYWMDYANGKFVTSDYYMDELPAWLKAFNKAKYADELAANGWSPLLSLEKYTESTVDDTPYEKVYNKNGKPVFPYDVSALIKENDYYSFALTPHGNTILRMLAEKVLVEEDLGDDQYTDLLAISFSSPDMIGHAFGPQSIEVEDTYIRLDLEIAKLLQTLDERVGKDNYVLFLTADHAAAEVPKYMKDHKMPISLFNTEAYLDGLKNHLNTNLNAGEWVRNYSNRQLFLNHELIAEQEVSLEDIYRTIESYTLDFDGISGVLNAKTMQYPLPSNNFAQLTLNGWNQQRSGDLVIQFLPGWMEYGHQGTTHGSTYSYDTHVPLMFYGKGVYQGSTSDYIDITQIAPTISVLGSMAFPMMSSHQVITKVLEEDQNQWKR
ncbi:MAG: alkaline phosphatase PafA [Salibacteraceae bacterium]